MLVLSPTIAAFDAYNAEVEAILSSLVVQRVGEPSRPPVTPSGGKLVVPAPTRPMVIADLAMTVMELNGPWYESIPADSLTNPEQGTNLDKKWVRLGARK